MDHNLKPLALALGAWLTQLGGQTSAEAAQTPDPAPAPSVAPSQAALPQGVKAVAPIQTAQQTNVPFQARPIFIPQQQFQGVPVNPGGLQNAHVNSGPTGHVNQGGHANFSRDAVINPGQIFTNPGGAVFNPGASHVNSGPTGHVNQGGHANFSRDAINPGQIFTNPGGAVFNPGASHVNSGPTGHVNQGGHANFSRDAVNPGQILLPGLRQR